LNAPKPVIASIGIGLQNAGEAGKMLVGMVLPSVTRCEEQGSRRIDPGEGPVIADIGPDPARIGFALGQNGHSGVIGMKASWEIQPAPTTA
jgi:hypothetical protein